MQLGQLTNLIHNHFSRIAKRVRRRSETQSGLRL